MAQAASEAPRQPEEHNRWTSWTWDAHDHGRQDPQPPQQRDNEYWGRQHQGAWQQGAWRDYDAEPADGHRRSNRHWDRDWDWYGWVEPYSYSTTVSTDDDSSRRQGQRWWEWEETPTQAGTSPWEETNSPGTWEPCSWNQWSRQPEDTQHNNHEYNHAGHEANGGTDTVPMELSPSGPAAAQESRPAQQASSTVVLRPAQPEQAQEAQHPGAAPKAQARAQRLDS